MLSRRQAWRRRTQVIHREEHDFIYKEVSTNSND